MVTHCVAFGCKNRFSKDTGIRFHRFPLNKKDLCKRWMLAIRRANWAPSISSRICSQHFLKSDYKPKYIEGRAELREDAVPSVFNFSPQPRIRNTLRRKEALVIHLDVPQKMRKCSMKKETDNLPVKRESDHNITGENNELEEIKFSKIIESTHTAETVHMNLLYGNESSSEVPSLQEETDSVSENEESNHFVKEEGDEPENSVMCGEEIDYKNFLFQIESSGMSSQLQTTNNITLVDVECQTEDNSQSPHKNELRKKVKTLQQKVRRQDARISQMKQLIKDLKLKNRTTNKVTDVQSNFYKGRPLMVVISGRSTFSGSEADTQ